MLKQNKSDFDYSFILSVCLFDRISKTRDSSKEKNDKKIRRKKTKQIEGYNV